MKNLKIFMITIMIAGIIVTSGNAFALSQPNIECQSGNICVHPGDFIAYSTEFNKISSTETYTFGDYIGSDKINLSITSNSNGTKFQSNNILDLKTGFYNETADSAFPILVMAPTPITIGISTPGVSEKTQSFKGIDRDVIYIANNTKTSSNEIGYDKETGVLMYLHLIPNSNSDILSPDLAFPTTYDLINTNMFANSGIQDNMQIPTWVKNNAKWWSQGSLSDDDFTKGIQYMIQNGIMKIPQTQSDSGLSHQIPSWVKTNAGWWADGQISDNDFVKGIQYLANNGIIHV